MVSINDGSVASQSRTRLFVETAALLFLTWLGVNAVWGLTSPGDTLISGWQRAVALLQAWVIVPAVILGAVLVVRLVRRQWGRAFLPAMLLGYLVGVFISRAAIVALSPANPVLNRSFVLLAAVPMLATLALPGVSWRTFRLRFGHWNRKGVLFGDANGSTWTKKLGCGILFVIVPIALVMQAARGFPIFAPGVFWNVIPLVIALSLVNAIAEEVLFRGFLQQPLVGSLGVPAGILFQAAFFGIHHWGSSPSIIAGIAMFPALTLLGYVWGKATYETDGLGWSVAFHTALGVAYFSAVL